VFDCSGGPTDGWSVTRLIGGSQNGDGASMLAFPENVAVPVRPNAVLLMNAHYINFSDEVLRPVVTVNLYTLLPEQVEIEGDILFLYNPLIRVLANSTGRAHWRCPVQQDITITNVQSHMHIRGVDYAASIMGNAPFYENDRWENVPVKKFEPGLEVTTGSVFDYYCDYENPENRDVYQGPRSTDEMCMLIGSYYPADKGTANCMNANGAWNGVWVGQGTATCAATMDCFEASFGSFDIVREITDCVMAAHPDVSEEFSAVLTCIIENQSTTPCATEIAACEAI
jgi:hypothetical protein